MFEFFSVPRIVFGRGAIARLPELFSPLGSRPLVIHNISDESSLRRITELLPDPLLVRQSGEPSTMHVDMAVRIAQDGRCDSIIGAGGGSAIDAAKAVAGLLANGGEALDYMEVVGKGRRMTQTAIPWAAIPTTAGTGAEVTRNAVIGYPQRQFKASIRGEVLLPRLALIDPELQLRVRPEITARSGMDALCQCIEAFTSRGANPMTDALALRGIELGAGALKKAFENGADGQAREEMALCALLSGIALTNAGLGAVHGFAAPMGASFPIPHGTICARLLAPVIQKNIAAMHRENHPGLARYAEVGRLLSGDSHLFDRDALAAASAQAAILARELQIPPLAQFGLAAANIPSQVDLAKKSSSMRYNPVSLSDSELADILHQAIEI